MVLPVPYVSYGIIYNGGSDATSNATVKISSDTNPQGTLSTTSDASGNYLGNIQNYANDGDIIRVHAACNGEVDDITYVLNVADIPTQYNLNLSDLVRNESVGLVDSKLKIPYKARIEYIGFIDTKLKQVNKTRKELSGLIDKRLRTITKVKGEQTGIVDSIIKAPYKVKGEQLGLIDTKQNIPVKVRCEKIGLVDSLVRMPAKTAIELIGLSDSIVRYITFLRKENVGLDDVVQKKISIVTTEIIGLLDSLITETIAITAIKATRSSKLEARVISNAIKKYRIIKNIETEDIDENMAEIFEIIESGNYDFPLDFPISFQKIKKQIETEDNDDNEVEIQ